MEHKIKRGVSAYSYNKVFGVSMDLDDIMQDICDTGATGIEILANSLSSTAEGEDLLDGGTGSRAESAGIHAPTQQAHGVANPAVGVGNDRERFGDDREKRAQIEIGTRRRRTDPRP